MGCFRVAGFLNDAGEIQRLVRVVLTHPRCASAEAAISQLTMRAIHTKRHTINSLLFIVFLLQRSIGRVLKRASLDASVDLVPLSNLLAIDGFIRAEFLTPTRRRHLGEGVTPLPLIPLRKPLTLRHDLSRALADLSET